MNSRDGALPAVLAVDDPIAVEVVRAIRTGDLDGLRRLLTDKPGLARVRVDDTFGFRTLLHVVADWPGHFPRGAETVAALVQAGPDVDAHFIGPNRRHRCIGP